MNTNNLIGEIKPLKNIEKEVATSNPKKQQFLKTNCLQEMKEMTQSQQLR